MLPTLNTRLRKSYAGFLGLLLCIVGFSPQLYAQTYSDSWNADKPGSHHVTNNGSDYAVTFTWSNIKDPTDSDWFNPCDCNDVGLQQVQYTTTANTTRSATASPAINFGSNFGSKLTSDSAILGPGYNQLLATWIRIDGQDDGLVTSCNGADCENFGWSGGPVLRVRTAPFKNPTSFTASQTEAQGSRLDKIVLEWGKGTDFPENFTQYFIYRKLSGAASYGSAIAAVDGDERSYEDNNVTANTTYDYKITTYSDSIIRTKNGGLFSAGWGNIESSGVTAVGKTETLTVNTSDGLYTNKIKVTWNSVATSASDIRVERSIPTPEGGGYDELAILNNNAKAYTDTDVIPGYNYTYKITPLDENGDALQIIFDQGWMRPNGIIKGKVNSRAGSGVQNVTITVEYASSLPGNKSPANSSLLPPYTTTTDVDGYYEIRNIYYYDSARFKITPSYASHGFTPPESYRILDLNTKTQTGVDFTDTTAITVSGRVNFQDPSVFGASGSDCGVQGATITINGIDYGIRTNANGNWSYALADSGNYGFKVFFKHHSFQVDSVNYDIGSDLTGVDFLDMEIDSIQVRVQDGCQNPLPTVGSQSGGLETPKIQVLHERGAACFEGEYAVDASGYATIVLPATTFKLSVDNTVTQHRLFNAAQRAQLDTVTYDFDLTVRDSMMTYSNDTIFTITPPDTLSATDSLGNPIILPGDTSYVVNEDSAMASLGWQADFVYFGPFDVTIKWEDAGAEIFADCNTSGTSLGDSIILLESALTYRLDIEIRDQAAGCLVDTGSVTIWDFISDQENSPVTVPIQNGHAYHIMQPGIPNVASGGNHPYQKYFYTKTSAGARSDEPNDWWALVTGARQLTPTFTSRSPEIPTLVIHDPPGDNSYAWVEKGASYRSWTNTSYEISGQAGYYQDLTFGTSVKTPFNKANLGIQWKLQFMAGRNNFDNEFYETTMTFEETFSTSDDPRFTGYDGDVYIGKATNQQFAIAKVLTYNETAACEANVADEPALYVTGIATTFIYSEKHIKNILIPQIVYLDSILRRQARNTSSAAEKAELIAEADSFGFDANNWRNILADVDTARDEDAVFIKNVSFSAGASYESSYSSVETDGSSYEYTEFVDIATSFGGKIKVEGGAWSDNTVGIAGKFRHSYTKDKGDDSTLTFTVGYHLEDKDIGDFFSVDVLEDKAYGVPAFRLFAGTSSCPHEEGTQQRDAAKIDVLPPVVDNVPIGGTANFTAYLTNESESQETREYHVRVIPQTNPQGAVVKIGGQIINNSTASFFLDAFQTSEIAFTVEQGPTASNYDSIGIMMYPPCEYNNGNLTSGDTTWINVNFQSECTSVSLNEPVQGWLVNGNSNNQLIFEFAGYDLNNLYFQSLTVEYKPNGQGWLEGPTIPRDSIVDVLYTYVLDVSGFSDGAYTMRVRANCSSGKGTTYSSAVSGLIDRNSIGPFGTPTPSDGFLRVGQDISVTFDKTIDCGFTNIAPTYNPTISLMRTDDSTFIPIDVQCSSNENRIILNPLINLFNMPELANVPLVASVVGIRDDQGNRQEYPISWAFIVNATPVNWDPDTLDIALAAGYSHTISSTLKNTSVLSKAFTIDSFPTWLTPAILSGSVLSDGEYEVNFVVSPDLPVGVYHDSVVATINGFPEVLYINYEAVAIPPNWNVDPSAYDYSMNVVCVFSLDQTDTNLSRNERDLIAAIYNGEIRGVANLEYVARFNKYIAFLTVYSNIIANEEITFSLWRATNGVEYRAAETLFFADDAVYGRIGDPEIFHTDGVYQVIPLKQGWNWMSLNVDNSDMTVANLLSSLGSTSVGNDITVKRKDGKTAQFTQIATPIIFGNQWTGQLIELDNKQGYMIYLSDGPDTLRVPGTPITNFSSIDMFSGWNWIGFQPQSTQSVGQALSSVNLRNKDLLKGQGSFSEYHKGWDTWYGPLQFMEPGKMYKLRLRDGVSYNDLVYSSRLGLDDFEVDHTRYEHSMTIVAKIGFEDQLSVARGQLDTERLYIGAFVNDSCRGYGKLEWVEFMNDYRAVFSVHGNITDIGSDMVFKVYDTHSGQEFICPNFPEKYISDYFLGNIREPYVLFDRLALPEAGYFLEQNYPNPYDAKTHIRFILPQTEEVKLSVYDQYGKEVKVLIEGELSAGEHSTIFDGSKLPSGVYHYSLQAGEYRASRKMVKF